MNIATNSQWLTADEIAIYLTKITGGSLSMVQQTALRCICDRLPWVETIGAFVASIEANASLLKDREHAIQTIAAVVDAAKQALSKAE